MREQYGREQGQISTLKKEDNGCRPEQNQYNYEDGSV
jgi:hypothetical protein